MTEKTTSPDSLGGASCSACGGSGMGKPMYRPEIDKTQRDRCYTCQGSGLSAPRPPAVEWQAANLHPCEGSGSTVKAWQLRVNGRVILNAVAMSDLHEAVGPEDRKMIGEALAEYLPNAKCAGTGDGGERMRIPMLAVRAMCERHEKDGLLAQSKIADSLIVWHLTENGRDVAGTLSPAIAANPFATA